MTILDVIITSLTALRSNILRTLLTMLGIIIGISAVITLTAAGQGAQQGVSDQIRGLGSNLMFVKPGVSTTGGITGLPGSGPSLFYEDAQAIDAAHLPYVEGIASQGSAGGPGSILQAQAIYRGQNTNTILVGTEPSYQSVRDFYVDRGRFLSEDDVTKKALNVVLGSDVAGKLLGTTDPIGQTVRIFVGVGRQGVGFNFTVVGVMEKKGASATGDLDNLVFVPLPSFQSRVAFIRNPKGFTNISQINIKLSDRSKETEARAEIGDILLKRHNSPEPDFTIQSQADVLSTATDVEKTLQVLLVSIALIALVVGGIGIMNIMLVSVTERTREIGIRKAVGAKRFDILLQFIIEALTVTIFGGLLGVGVGYALTQILQHDLSFDLNLLVYNYDVNISGNRYVMTPFWIAMGLGMSAVTGLVFGVYPAWRASRLDPIEALRRE
ncbi:MAG: ABC transporter permease [Chloroflexota bacterium]|nr:ABC transporter permease [Chloroflexota bacterium]